MLRRCLVALCLVAGCLLATVGPAQACPRGSTPSPTGGAICIPVSDPGGGADPGGSENGGDAGTTSTSSGGCQRADGSEVDCVSPYGVWDSGHQCWIHRVDVPHSDPVWKGHTDGATWMCALITDGMDPVVLFWLPPGGAAIVLPDPGELAHRALGLLRLATAEVHTAPQDPARTFVGVENWLWVPRSQWATLTKSVSAGATTVTVTAKPAEVKWQTGRGTELCHDAGRAWAAGMTDAATTSCGVTYRVTSDSAANGAFTLSASIGYQVDWVCNGACTSGSGDLGLVDAPTGVGRLRVLQRQTVVTQ